jgi:predicted lipoprotein with Yx(FWY)xxD motif
MFEPEPTKDLADTNTNSMAEIIKDKKVTNFTPLLICVVIAGLLAVTLYLYFQQLGDETTVTTEDNGSSEVVEDDPDNQPVINLEALAAQRLEEIDQGQGLVDVVIRDNQELILTTPDGRTLYQRTEGFCEGECLNTWLPYSSTEAFEGARLRSVLVNEEYNLHYVLLDNKMLFTYSGDLVMGSTTGNGLDGVWTLARP